jgi:hypothetical protein
MICVAKYFHGFFHGTIQLKKNDAEIPPIRLYNSAAASQRADLKDSLTL